MWETLGGILAGLAALISSITALVGATTQPELSPILLHQKWLQGQHIDSIPSPCGATIKPNGFTAQTHESATFFVEGAGTPRQQFKPMHPGEEWRFTCRGKSYLLLFHGFNRRSSDNLLGASVSISVGYSAAPMWIITVHVLMPVFLTIGALAVLWKSVSHRWLFMVAAVFALAGIQSFIASPSTYIFMSLDGAGLLPQLHDAEAWALYVSIAIQIVLGVPFLWWLSRGLRKP
jgi:hypothetical protein